MCDPFSLVFSLPLYFQVKVKLSLCLIKHHIMKMCGGVEVYRGTFINVPQFNILLNLMLNFNDPN
jgi:hypothetical protein